MAVVINGQTYLYEPEALNDTNTAKAVNTGPQTKAALHATIAAREVGVETFMPGFGISTLPNDGIADAQPFLQYVVNTAAASVALLGPVHVKITAGQWRLNTALKWGIGGLGSGVGFIGAGRANTKFLPYGTAVIQLDTSWPDRVPLESVDFSDFTIDCINQSNTPNQVGTKGLSFRWMTDCNITRVRVVDSWATAFGCDFLTRVRFDSHSGGFFFERLISIPGGARAGRGQSIIGGGSLGGYNGIRDAGADGLIVEGGNFSGASNAGLHIEGYATNGRHGGRNGKINNSVFGRNGVGVLIGNAATGGYDFLGNEISDNNGPAVTAATTSQMGAGWRFMSNRMERNIGGGLLLDAPLCGRPQIIGNVIRENGVGDGIRIGGDLIEPTILNNTIQGHIGWGINLSDATHFQSMPVIQTNRITENSLGPINNVKATDSSTGITNNVTTAAFTAITNNFNDPCYTQGVSLVAALSRFDAPVQVTGATDAKYGTTYARMVVNAAGSASARIGRRTAAMTGAWTISAWVRTSTDAVIRPFGIAYWASNASQRTWHRGGIRSTGDWLKVSITVILPSDGSRLDAGIGLDNASAGMTLDIMGTQMTPGTVSWPSFDGTNAPPEIPAGTVAWTGTAGASTSTLTVGTPPATILDSLLLTASGGETPAVSQVGATIGTGLTLSLAQTLTMYTVVSGAPAASMRASLRTSTSGDRFAIGRNSGNTAWIATANDSAHASHFSQLTASAVPSVVSAVRDATGVTIDLAGTTAITAITAITDYEAINATRIVNDPGVAHTLVYTGVHDATKRAAVVAVLAGWYL